MCTSWIDFKHFSTKTLSVSISVSVPTMQANYTPLMPLHFIFFSAAFPINLLVPLSNGETRGRMQQNKLQSSSQRH